MKAYLPILVIILFIFLFVGVALLLSHLVSPRRIENVEPYECGIISTGRKETRYAVRFYIIALLFLIFDVEIAFIFPWAVQVKELGITGLLEMMLFIGILITGFIYVWRFKGLKWS